MTYVSPFFLTLEVDMVVDMNDLEIIARQYKTFCVKHTLDSPLAMQAFKSCVQQWGVMKSMSSLLFNVFDRYVATSEALFN